MPGDHEISPVGLTVTERMQAAVARSLAALPDPVLRRLVGRPVIVDGQQLHPETQLTLKLLDISGGEPLQKLSAVEARARVAADARTFQGSKVALAEVRDLQVAGAAGELAARLYIPDSSDPEAPLAVYFHGGGFVVGDLDTHDNVCRFLAGRSGSRILAVDYRLGPEYPFPAAFEDAVAAFRFVISHRSELDGGSGRVGVAGDSAGGNLAAGVARALREDEGPAFQLLFYPWLDLAEKRPSYGLFRDGFYLSESDLDWYRLNYLSAPEDAQDPRCSPLASDDMQGLAPAYVTTAGFDPLRDEGEEYVRRLRSAGVPAVLRRHPGLIHGFVNTISMGSAAREAVLEAAGALRLGLSAWP